ncbi:MAG: hypothetical protein ACRCU5_15725 [Rhizobiaceae bacterium]
MRIIGIDPGQNTGVAIFDGGKLVELLTIEPADLGMVISGFSIDGAPDRVVFEDSRLQSHVWVEPKANRSSAIKIARNLGQIDAWCKFIAVLCARAKVDSHGISPKSKGSKLNAAQFKAVTGWAGKSNQHERDGAMVAWPYRRVA